MLDEFIEFVQKLKEAQEIKENKKVTRFLFDLNADEQDEVRSMHAEADRLNKVRELLQFEVEVLKGRSKVFWHKLCKRHNIDATKALHISGDNRQLYEILEEGEA